MLKKSNILIIALLLCCSIDAQTLQRVVYDKETKQPVPDVHVYFDGTTVYAITNSSGKFELPLFMVKNMINPKLVLQHVAYQAVIIENPLDNLPEKLYIEERPLSLNEVSIVHEQRFSRKQMLKTFKEQFLGETSAGKSCKILNEDDIRIWYNGQTKTLSASSEHPIVVINEYLGYRMSFMLTDFFVEYSHVTLSSKRIKRTFYKMTTSYSDLYPNDRIINNRRETAYENSRAFFFKNFADNSLTEAGFRTYKVGSYFPGQLTRFRIDNIQHEFYTIKDTLTQKIITSARDPNLLSYRNEQERDAKIFVANIKPLAVTYRGNVSDINILTDTLFVDKYGNIDQIDKVQFSGEMAKYRVGDMLPLDYVSVKIQTEMKHPMEKQLSIEGIVFADRGRRSRPLTNITVALWLYGKGFSQYGETITDSVGKFSFGLDDFYGIWHLVLQTKKNDRAVASHIVLNNDFGATSHPFPYNADSYTLFIDYLEQHLLVSDGYEFRHNTKKVLFNIKGDDYLDFDDRAHLYDIREILLEDVASFWIDETATLAGLQDEYVMIYVYLKSSNYEDPIGVKRMTLQGFSN